MCFFPNKSHQYSFITPYNICCVYSLEVPHRGTSNKYPLPTIYVFVEKEEKYLHDTPSCLELWSRGSNNFFTEKMMKYSH